MKKEIMMGGTVLMLAASAAFGADQFTADKSVMSANDNVSYDQSGDRYRGNEWSLDAFGADSMDEHSVDHLDGHRVRHDSVLSAGLGLNYFIIRYIGVGVDAYTENTQHSFVDDFSGSLIGRLPIGNTGLAPYVFAGGGHKFDPVIATEGHVGGGLEYRFTHNVGVFVDARWVWTDRVQNYGLGRFGLRYAF